MKILVTGGTGNVGGAVITELLKLGAELRVLVRRQPQADKLPREWKLQSAICSIRSR